MKTPRLSLLPSHLALACGKEGALDVVVRLSAPSHPAAAQPARPSLNLALVIDKSGSMAGAPLESAKAAAAHLVRSLAPGDQACVVVYGNEVAIVAEPTDAVAGRQHLLSAIASITSNGGTPLRAGWLLGAQALAPHVSRFGLSRVLLISDGQATDGSVPEALANEARELATSGISTSTYGLGYNFNEDLMTRLAQGGQGQAFYAESAEALLPYFESEFQMLASTMGKNVRVALAAHAQGKPLAIQGLDTLAEAAQFPMPPLVAGTDSWVAARVVLPSMDKGATVEISGTVSWQDLQGKTHSQPVELSVPVRARAKAGTDGWGLERIREVNAARLQREALENARRGNWARTDEILRGLSASSVGNAYMADVSANLSQLAATRDMGAFVKEAAYASHTMASRVVDQGEDVAVLSTDRFGLRKASQGKAAAPKSKEASP